MKNRFISILNRMRKKNCALVLILIFLAVGVLGALMGCTTGNTDPSKTDTPTAATKGTGPFVGYVKDLSADTFDVYTEESGTYIMLRIGVRISVQETAAAWVTVGPIRIQVAPSKPKKDKKKAEPKKKKTTDGKDKLKRLKKLPKPTLEDIRSAIETLGPPLNRALYRTRRGIRIHPLHLSVTVGGANNPAEAAELYGLLHAAVWTAMPVAEELLVIPEPSIHGKKCIRYVRGVGGHLE